MVAFHRSTIESILTYCISVWLAGLSAADRRAVQRINNTAQKTPTGAALLISFYEELYNDNKGELYFSSCLGEPWEPQEELESMVWERVLISISVERKKMDGCIKNSAPNCC